MNSRFLHIIFCAVGIVLASCSSSDNTGQPATEEMSVAFDAATVPITRAKGDFNSVEELRSEPRGIGIFASYTGALRYASATVRPNFMCNQRAVWTPSSGTWTYSPLKYWPNGQGEATDQGQGEIPHKVSFFAYAPWSDLITTSSTDHAPANCITRCAETYDEGDPWLYYRLAGTPGSNPTGQQVDLLYAVCDYDYYGTDEGMCNIDLTKPDIAKRVKFIFHHALGCVGDRVTITASEDLRSTMQAYVGRYEKVELVILGVDIKYTLTGGATLSLWNRRDAPNWQADTEHNVKTTRGVTLLKEVAPAQGQGSYAVKKIDGGSEVTLEQWVNEGNGVFYIPVEGDDYVQSATINVKYLLRYYTNEELTTYTDMPPVEGSATVRMRDYIATSEAHGRNLFINVQINVSGDVVASIDVMNAAFTPWTAGGSGEHEVYNW